MFDVSFGELLLLAIVALVVLGPEKLPHAARMTGAWVGRIRRTVLSVQAEIEKEVNAQEMRQRIEEEMRKMRESNAAQELKAGVDSINQSLHEVETTAREALAAEAPAQPATVEVPTEPVEVPAEKPGEEAFKAYVQSSHNRILPETAPAAEAPVPDQTKSPS